MVLQKQGESSDWHAFQYSLCRVVLMVSFCTFPPVEHLALSVLALSSRFDGQCSVPLSQNRIRTFSTRSVESF